MYDLAGNTTQRQTTHGTTVMTYDAAGQLTRRITPAVTYGQTACNVFFTTEYCLYSFPTFGGSSVCVSADTAYFAYDSRGQVKAADNIHARIRRTYKPNGLLHSDTLRVRTYYSMGSSPCEATPNPGYIDEFGKHVYTLTYIYNRDGQRTSLSHPAGTQSYSYGAGGRGLLTGITDFESRSYTIDYDASGRVRVVHYPGSVNESRTYGTDGRMSVRDVTNVIHDQLTYDRQNRITSAYNLYRGGSNSDQTASTEYSGLGAVVSAGNYGGQTGWAETFTVDALGNRLRRQQQGMRPPEHPDSWGIRHSTYDSDARLTSVKDTVLSGMDPYIFEEYYWYDGAGNTDIDFLHETDFYGSGTFFEATKHYYGADEKLRVLNRHGGLGTTSDDSRPGRRGAFEEYRYDALGRRVLVRSRHGTACFTSSAPIECAQYLERTVWDGDQVLIEYRADGSDDGVTYELNETSDGDAYGRIVYTHAFGIDQPLSVSKGGVAVMPHANWRGQYEVGTLASGASTTTCTGAPGCPRIDWPGAVTALDGSKTNPGNVYTWYGSLITGKAEGSGLMYMRNRYYDPKTGRFTQQDPIGLGGGLNAYGFASGDPVNYSDPMGLCPVCLVALAAYEVYEIGSSVYDVYQAGKTLADPNASRREKITMVGLAAAGVFLPGGGYTAAGKRIIKYSDEIIDVGLRWRSLTSGSKKLRALGLTERVTERGRHEFVDGAGRVRAAWDAETKKWGSHWHKFAPDGTPLTESGHAVTRNEGRAHIPSR